MWSLFSKKGGHLKTPERLVSFLLLGKEPGRIQAVPRSTWGNDLIPPLLSVKIVLEILRESGLLSYTLTNC